MCDMSDINKITEGKVPAIYFMDRIERKSKSNQGRKFVPVDQWWPQNMEEVIISCRPGFFIAPLSVYFNISIGLGDNFNKFILSTKKCYNSVAMREHLFKYLNYFLNYIIISLLLFIIFIRFNFNLMIFECFINNETNR